jgi:hypothetical protein
MRAEALRPFPARRHPSTITGRFPCAFPPRSSPLSSRSASSPRLSRSSAAKARTMPPACARARAFPPSDRCPDGGCTLVAPRWALTAAHVAAGMKPGSRVRFEGTESVVRRVVLHPQGEAPRGQPPEVDLALVEFESEVQGIQPMPLYRGREEMAKTLWLVGYGDFGNAGAALAHSDGRRRAVANAVDDAGPKRLFLRFDAPPAGVAMEGVGGPGDSGGAAVLDPRTGNSSRASARRRWMASPAPMGSRTCTPAWAATRDGSTK